MHSKGPGGPSDYIGYTSVTERNDPALAPFEDLTGALVVFTRLGSLGMGFNHTLLARQSHDSSWRPPRDPLRAVALLSVMPASPT